MSLRTEDRNRLLRERDDVPIASLRGRYSPLSRFDVELGPFGHAWSDEHERRERDAQWVTNAPEKPSIARSNARIRAWCS
ncbi:MAG: hypothetical protein ACFCUG_11640 [Thiotrichales bacterium]